MTKLIYLASPYSHTNEAVRQARTLYISIIGSQLIEDGHHIFGPIAESTRYANVNKNLDGQWEFWQKHDLLMIDKCDEMWVACLHGWDKSTGVTAEIKYAKSKGMEVRYLNPSHYLPFEIYYPDVVYNDGVNFFMTKRKDL